MHNIWKSLEDPNDVFTGELFGSSIKKKKKPCLLYIIIIILTVYI